MMFAQMSVLLSVSLKLPPKRHIQDGMDETCDCHDKKKGTKLSAGKKGKKRFTDARHRVITKEPDIKQL
jgi:hypothetical protein